MLYVLPNLPYPQDALEPYIDSRTMQIHHGAHHKGYIDKLNAALKDHPEYQMPLEQLLKTLDKLPENLRGPVLKNGGGHANHTLFWTLLTPQSEKSPSGELQSVIESSFGSFGNFKTKFTETAASHFNNGWAWLYTDKGGHLQLSSTKDHETPLMQGNTPLLVLDLWEHAYYLKYQNRKPEYIDAFWNIVNWKEVSNRWTDFKKDGTSNREWRVAV